MSNIRKFMGLLSILAAMEEGREMEDDEISLSKEDFAELEMGDSLVIAKPSSNSFLSNFNYQEIGYFINSKTLEQLRTKHAVIEEDCPYKFYNYTFIERVETTYKCGHCDNDHKHDILVYCEETKESFYANHDCFRLKR